MKELPYLQVIMIEALQRAYRVHQDLGATGMDVVQKNQFGETALRVDVEIEKAIIAFLQARQVPLRLISEEHGTIDIVSAPRFLGILDGLDGSNRYQAGRGIEKYGTMFGIFLNSDPVYDDYVCSGIMEHSTCSLFIATKSKGAGVIGRDGRHTVLKVSGHREMNSHTRVYLNRYWEVCRDLFETKVRGSIVSDPRAYSTYFSDLASGVVDLVITSTGKNNLEIAIGYGLVKEAGGEIFDIDCCPLADKKYFGFAQDVHVPILVSANFDLTRAVLNLISSE
ncbi:MAG TPA: inositol monophosphatase family protein [Candidatus Paceibacterota bacterium]|nr:inositol monophosphatase family protein [Candidatus Paceibacterota bacterium]